MPALRTSQCTGAKVVHILKCAAIGADFAEGPGAAASVPLAGPGVLMYNDGQSLMLSNKVKCRAALAWPLANDAFLLCDRSQCLMPRECIAASCRVLADLVCLHLTKWCCRL